MAADNINLTTLGKASFPDFKTPTSLHEDHAHIISELLSCGSLEYSNGKREEIAAVAGLLPRGMPVFVPVLPSQTLTSRLELMRDLHGAGLDPVPHLAARRIPSRKVLVDFLAEARDTCGLHRALVIGGDSKAVAGPYPDARAVLDDVSLAEFGVREVGLAGYPEGHPSIDSDRVRQALLDKLRLCEAQGLGCHVVTQFSFVPARILEYCTWLSATAPDIPVYVGLAGPATLRQLVHFARYCGVAASLSAVGKVGVKVAQLASHMRADEQMGLLASWVDAHGGSSNITGTHVFSFGGFASTAGWIHERIHA